MFKVIGVLEKLSIERQNYDVHKFKINYEKTTYHGHAVKISFYKGDFFNVEMPSSINYIIQSIDFRVFHDVIEVITLIKEEYLRGDYNKLKRGVTKI